MSPGAVDRGARGTDASVARRPLHGRDRARLPRTRADHRATDRPRETNPDRGARSVRGPRGKRSRGPARVGARGDLPHLQRGLLGDRRRRLDAAGPLPGCAPPRPPRRGAAPARARGPWPRCPHGDPSVAHEGARGTCRRADPPPRSEPRAVGPTPHPSRVRRARTRGGARGRAWTLRAAGGDRRLSCPSPHARGNGLAPDRGALRRARAARTLTGRGAEPRRCLRDGVRSRGGPRARRRPRGGAFTPLLPSPAERSRRPPRKARPFGRSAFGVRARRSAHTERARARAPARARGCVPAWKEGVRRAAGLLVAILVWSAGTTSSGPPT